MEVNREVHKVIGSYHQEPLVIAVPIRRSGHEHSQGEGENETISRAGRKGGLTAIPKRVVGPAIVRVCLFAEDGGAERRLDRAVGHDIHPVVPGD